jgi:hypothetical protein
MRPKSSMPVARRPCNESLACYLLSFFFFFSQPYTLYSGLGPSDPLCRKPYFGKRDSAIQGGEAYSHEEFTNFKIYIL